VSTEGPRQPRRPTPPAGRDAARGSRTSDGRSPTRGGAGRSRGAGGESPSFLAMIGVVALLVATVIIVFFVIGYVLGRLFL
jgi:hypothetical protein